MEFSNYLQQAAIDLEKEIDRKTSNKIQSFLDEIEVKRQELEALVHVGGTVTVKIDDTVNQITGLKHEKLPKLISICANRIPVLLVGMAGTGKTHAGEQVSEAMGLPFYAMSVGAQTSKSDLMGFIHATGDYVPTLFRKAFEEGGVFLMDEIDAGNANVLIQVNAALSNSYCAFPDKMVKKHKDFVFIASANTYGMGASRQYVGRNQLDAATLDRFTMLDWDVDAKLEKALAGSDEVGQRWYKMVKQLREYIQNDGMRALVTPRATLKGATLLRAGMTFNDVLQLTILGMIPADKQARIKERAASYWE